MSETTWDVVIVGAGLSGLSAAHSLRKRNPQLKIIILEGKDRVGGRTVTEDLPAVNGLDRWDLGGQWVSSSQTHVMDLIHELGLEVYPQYTAGKKVQHLGGPRARIRTYSTSIPALSPLVLLDLTQLLWKINRLCASVSVDDPSRTPNAAQLDSMTLHSYLERHAWTQVLKEEMGIVSRVVFGMEPCQMSLLFFLLYAATAGGVLALMESSPGAAQEFRVKGGTQQLSQGLAERLGSESVRLGQAVTAIWQDGECARVQTATASFLGLVVIVTCPPHLAGFLAEEGLLRGDCGPALGGLSSLRHLRRHHAPRKPCPGGVHRRPAGLSLEQQRGGGKEGGGGVQPGEVPGS